MINIIEASTIEDFENVKKLFLEYVKELNVDLSFQNFEEEFKNLPAPYTFPEGSILLALKNNKIIGCVALKKLKSNICEMKRLFVIPEFRKYGTGKILVQAIIEKSKSLNYDYMYLDTFKRLKSAIYLYELQGFYTIEPYYNNPFKDVIYMAKKLN